MKKIIYSFLFLSALGTGAYAQQADSRIAAILAKEPAQKATDLNANAEATAALGENGITGLLLQLQPNGSADNTKIYDAVNGFSYYVTQTGRESLRALAVKAYSSALSKLTDKYNQAFIISQLQIIGKDDAVPALKQYLGDERLVDPATRALVKVNTPLSKSTLLQALKGSAGQARLSLVEALGDSEYALAAGPIAGLIGQDKKLDRVSLYALAHIANLKSAGVLAQSAQNVGYTLDESNATSAYVTFISNLAKKGFATNAFALAKSLQANAANAGQVQTQTAALKILVDIRGAKSTPLLLQAIGDKNPQYRAAALKYAAPYLGPATVQLWLKALASADKTTKAELIAFFGNNHAYAALPAITRSLNDTDPAIVLAAIKAAQQIGQDKVINNLIGALKSDNADYATAVQNALLVVKGPAVVNKVAQALPDVPANGKVALINVLAARRAHDKIDIVWALLNNSDNQVRSAAYASLQSLAEENNLPQLFNLLGKSEDPAHTADVQTAINAVISRLKKRFILISWPA